MHLVYRSYGGGNAKKRPDFYSKALTLASFLLAASKVPDAEVIFLNNGPIKAEYLSLMERFGRVIRISEEPVGVQDSYRFALSLPDREGWSDDDIVSYNEDDYLFHPAAFTALAQAVRDLPGIPYFAFQGRLPEDEDPEVARLKYALPHDWKPQPDLVSGDRVWCNVASTTATFSARVGTFRQDLPIFYQCMRPFIRRFMDHETCLLYQGCVPYRGREILVGLPNDFEATPKGIIRTVIMVPYRIALNRRAARQALPHLLYVPRTELAGHLEVELVKDDHDWMPTIDEVIRWAASTGRDDIASLIRGRLTLG